MFGCAVLRDTGNALNTRTDIAINPVPLESTNPMPPKKNSSKKSVSKKKARPPKAAAHPPRAHFDCDQCPSFCCTIYERVHVTDSDLARMAEYFGLSLEETETRFTKMWDGKERILKRKRDPILEQTCRFLDLKTRGCTIYEARPEACRDYPDEKRCAYYDVLKFEQRHQDDASALPLFRIEFKEWNAYKKAKESGE
jgi:Fe-S-cluster containining protein